MVAKNKVSTQNAVHGGKKSSVAAPKAEVQHEAFLARCITYFKQVIALARRVIWPDRRATFTTTLFVLVMVSLTCIFFLVVDQIIGFGLHTLFQIGG